jgi:hypothetical protein
VEPSRRADELNRQAVEQLQRADWALMQLPREKVLLLKRERKKRRKEAWKTLQRDRDLKDAIRDLEAQLKTLEAAFARHELFRFLKSRRYELTPLSLANAAAGLPYMGWRHSMRKNAEVPSIAANGSAYQLFKAVRYLAGVANKKTEREFIADFRENIPSLPSRYRSPREELAEKWLLLELAIRKAYRMYLNKHNPKDLAFEITKQYFVQIRSQSNVDRVLAERARLRLASKPMKK